MPSQAEMKPLPSYPSKEGIILNFSDPDVQADFLTRPKEERQKFINEQQEFQDKARSVSEAVFKRTLPFFTHVYEFLEDDLIDRRQQLFEDRLLHKEDLAIFEEENPIYSLTISLVQKALEAIPPEYRKGFDIRDYLVPVGDKDEAFLRTGKTKKDDLKAFLSRDNLEIIWNVDTEDHDTNNHVNPSSPEYEYILPHTFSLLCASLDLITSQEIRIRNYGKTVEERQGFSIIYTDTKTGEQDIVNEKLNEATKLTLVYSMLLKYSPLGRFIDQEKVNNSEMKNLCLDISELVDFLPPYQFQHCYLTGNFELLREKMKETQKQEGKPGEKVIAIFNRYSGIKI